MEHDKPQTTLEKTELQFQKLTPSNVENMSVYTDALKFVFANDDVKNVAISGSYGAGKSSVLETYKQSNADIKFLHISLADFKPYNPKNPNTDATTVESVLEGKILNQLLHQIEPERIPQTGFHVKQKVTTKRVCLEALMVVAFVGIMLYLVFFQRWKAFVSTLEGEWLFSFLKETITNKARLLFLIDECILFVCGTAYAIWKQRTVGILKKVSLQGNEFEIGKENDESIFDRYLNEVLYLFEHADADIIVFEDLDRHESSDIFTRLREINTLVNQRRAKRLRFFYLLRDDVFSTKDRAKFFDFIIPIVPVLDGSNAYDKFLEFFKQGGILDLSTRHFLQGLSLYIDEMRILKNIINEFQVYYHRLNTTGLSRDKMLALITYKNLFPKDFAELQLNRGFVYALFENKPNFIKVKREHVEKEIVRLQAQLELAAKAFITSDEIDSIINYQDPYYRSNPFVALKQKLNQAKEFYAAKTISEQESTADALNKLKEELARLEHAKLCKLLSRDNIDKVFCENKHVDGNGTVTKFEEIKQSDYFALLKYLVREGHIEEGYPDYMTYFYPESISKNDKTFLRSVADKKELGCRYPLDSPEKVISRLSSVDFDQPETLNFALLNYVLNYGNETYVQKLLDQLKASNNIAFINDYLQSAEDSLVIIISKLNVTWSSFFKSALTCAAFQSDNRVLWAKTTLCVTQVETIKTVNEDNCLRDFISETPEFLDGEPLDQSKLIHGMQLIGVEMKTICREKANADLLKAVYEKNLYALNASNILLMLNLFYKDNSMAKLGSRSYSEIMKPPMSPLAKRVQAFINNYLDIVFQTCNGKIEDDPNDACNILNNKSVSSERKAKYITLLKTIIKSLDDIEDLSLWGDLLRHRRVVCSPNNIVCYFTGRENTIDDVLVAFINNGKQDELCFSDDDLFEDDEQQAAFFENVVVCSGIENSRYELILGSLNQSYVEFDVEEMPIEKVSILIKLGKIGMTNVSLDNIRGNYSECLPVFIKMQFDDYLKLVPNLCEKNELRMILSSSDFTEEQKNNLLQITTAPISVQGLKCSETLKARILCSNWDSNDTAYLVQHYAEFTPDTQTQIVSCLVGNPSHLMAERISLPIPLLDRLIEDKTMLVGDQKVDLFANSLDKISDSATCQAYLSRLHLDEFGKVFTSGRPKILTDITAHAHILEHFKKNNWISDYVKDASRPDYFKIKKNKNQDEADDNEWHH